MDFEELIENVKNIPYGRNSNRKDFSLVISENKGTCSSKHAFLKDFANKNNIPDVDLIIGIYKMNETNTKIGTILKENNLDYLPEAHCYLKVNGNVIDATNNEANFEKLRNDILEEIIIEPDQVGDFKVKYHQNFLKIWITKNKISFTFEEIWNIREKCIQKLSNIS
jgi:hypothetical protein